MWALGGLPMSLKRYPGSHHKVAMYRGPLVRRRSALVLDTIPQAAAFRSCADCCHFPQPSRILFLKTSGEPWLRSLFLGARLTDLQRN